MNGSRLEGERGGIRPPIVKNRCRQFIHPLNSSPEPGLDSNVIAISS